MNNNNIRKMNICIIIWPPKLIDHRPENVNSVFIKICSHRLQTRLQYVLSLMLNLFIHCHILHAFANVTFKNVTREK